MVATARPPIRQEAPVKAGERIPMSPRADTTIDEMRETDGTGSLWTVQAPPVLRDSLGNRGEAYEAACARSGGLGAVGAGASAGRVHEALELKGKVELGVKRDPEAQLMARADLVLLAGKGCQGGAALVLGESEVVVGAIAQVAGPGQRVLARARAADCEGTGGQVVAKGDQVTGREAEELDHHVPSKPHLALVGGGGRGRAPGIG